MSSVGSQLTYFDPKTSRVQRRASNDLFWSKNVMSPTQGSNWPTVVQRRAPTDLLQSKTLSVQHRAPSDLLWSKNVTCPTQGPNWPTSVQNVKCPMQRPNWPILFQKRYVSNAGPNWPFRGSDGWFPIIKGHNTNWLMHWRKRISRQSQIFKNAIFFKSQNISGQNSSYVQCM